MRTTTTLAILALLLVACGDGTPATPGADAATDATADLPDDAEFILGTMPAYSRDFAAFEPLTDGQRVDVVMGSQGLLMIVLAFKSRGIFHGSMGVSADLAIEGMSIASLALDEQRVVTGPDGYSYYMDFFLVVDGLIALGREGELTFTALDQDGHEVVESATIQVGDPLYVPPTCLPQGPGGSAVTASCDAPPSDVAVLATDVAVHDLDAAPQGKSAVGIAGATDDAVHLWIASGGALLGSWEWPASDLTGGPWAIGLDGTEFGVVWSDAEGIWLGLSAAESPDALLVQPNSRAAAAFEGAGQIKLLAAGDEVVDIVHLSTTGEELGRHFVNGADKVRSMAAHVAGDSIFIVYTGADPTKPLFFQSSGVAGGQCSIPAPLGAELGETGELTSTAVSYGVPLVAFRVPPQGDCPQQNRILGKTMVSEGFESEVGFRYGTRTRILPDDAVATVVGLVPDGDGWAVTGQFIDVQKGRTGSTSTGFVVEEGEVPDAWDVVPSGGQRALVWASDGEIRMRSFCF